MEERNNNNNNNNNNFIYIALKSNNCPKQQQSFDELKKRLSSAETLAYFDKNAPAKVIADASHVGLGAVLVQEQGEELRVISYASRSLYLRTDNGPHFTSERFTK